MVWFAGETWTRANQAKPGAIIPIMNLAERRRDLSSRLDVARRSHHLSIRDLARIAEVPTPTMQGWLNGRHFPVPALRPAFIRVVHELGLSDHLSEDLWDSSATVGTRLRSGRAPYLGLRPFRTGDRELYFGRRDESARLAQAILQVGERGGGLIAVVGASGSGKSSLLAAGLIAGECVDGALASLEVTSVAVERLAEAAPDVDLVVVDQFEEVFAFDDDRRLLAFSGLAAMSTRSVVVLGLRADAFAEASFEPLLAEALSAPFLVTALNRDQAKEVIVGPAASVGIQVDDDLVQALLDDLSHPGRPNAVTAEVLPLLSNALLVTWAAGEGSRMTVSDYVRSGGVWSALQGLAEEVFTGLDEQRRSTARALFLRLVRSSGDLLVRECLPLADLGLEAREVMRPFVDARLLTVSDGTVQISHDALIANWTRLQDWLAESRADREVVDQLRRASRLWSDAGRSVDALIPVDRLEVFAEWVGDPARQELLGPREIEFVEASRAHFASRLRLEQQISSRLRRGRRMAMGLTAAVSVLALVAGGLYLRGIGLQAETDQSRLEAQSRQVALEARSVRADDPNLMAQMSLVADSLATTRQSTSALLDATSENTALRWLGKPNAVIAKTSDDQLVARADGSGQVTIWRGTELTSTPGSTFAVDPVSGPLYALSLVNADGRVLMAVGGGTAAGLWDVTGTPTLVADLRDGDFTTFGAAFTGDGRHLALATSTGEVRLWTVPPTGAPVNAGAVRVANGAPVKAVVYAPNGELFAAGLTDAVAHFAAGDNPRRLPNLTFHYVSAVASQSLGISPDGTQLAAGLAGRTVARWRLDGSTATAIEPLTGFTSWTNDISYSTDGSRMIVANSDRNAYVFDARSGALLETLGGSTIDTGAELIGGRPVTSGADGALRVWQADGRVLRQASTLYALGVDPGERFLAASSLSDGLALWDTSGGYPNRLPDPATLGRRMSSAVTVAPNATFLVGGTTDGYVYTWPLTASGTGAPEVVSAFPGSYIGSVAVSPDSSLVAALQYTGTQVALFRADAGGHLTEVSKLDTPTPQGTSFSPDGKLLAVPIVGGIVQLWDVTVPAAPKLAGKIEGLGALPTIVAFANTTSTLAVATDSGQVMVWDVADPTHPVQKRAYGDPHAAVYGVAFSPKDDRLAAVGGDGLVWAWQLDGSNAAYLSLNGDGGSVNDVRFLAGGDELVAGGDAGTLRMWTANPDRARTQLCANRGDQLTTEEWQRFLPGIAYQDPC